MSAQNTKILLIDDDAEIRYSLDRVLSQDGHDVVAADAVFHGCRNLCCSHHYTTYCKTTVLKLL